ncbi:hypothetical protein [Corynebacterium lubricantis]|uniref:hypothetical protein n=1 Tax=Corynebacterium lubricantis TaxID=541095 RepID=UPI00037992DB|nr:hypothetical protein [Corynebacterium lubricantis]
MAHDRPRTPSRRFATFLTVGAVSIASSACSPSSSEEPIKVVTITQTTTPAPEKAPETLNPEEIYAAVLSDPSAYPVNSSAEHEPDGTYSYAVVEATGDSSPELLIKVNGREFTPVMVFTIDQSSGELIHSPHVLIAGARSAGGGRADVAASRTGTGIHEMTWQSISPTGKDTLYELHGDQLVPSTEDSYQIEAGHPDHAVLSWFDTNDPSHLGFVQNAGNTSTPANAITFSGTVINQTAVEAMNGRPTPNGEPDIPGYIQLVLDSPQEVTASKAGDFHTESVEKIRLATPHDTSMDWEPYVGQHVTITTTPEHLAFPSDTSIPLGMLIVSGSPDISVG